MTSLQRYVFFRKRGLRPTLAWLCADLPRRDAVFDFVNRLAVVAGIVFVVLAMQALMEGR
jgi:hypothetical protein